MSGRPPLPTDQSTFTGCVCARIRDMRMRRKLTVEACAAVAGVPKATWYAWEAGRRMPLDALPRIAEALGCNVGRLVED